MELNNPEGDSSAPWYVSSGLLANELIEGRVQVDTKLFIPLAPANIPIAGDRDNAFPTYASLRRVYHRPMGRQVGDVVIEALLPAGTDTFPRYANHPPARVATTIRGYGIPQAFWGFMNQRGTVFENGALVPDQPLFEWEYVLGYPVTPALWTRVRVKGVEQDVMVQAFERRVLTYTPSNPARFQVEMGNIGRHYYEWRYVAPFAFGNQAVITAPRPGAGLFSTLDVSGFGSGNAFEGAITVRLRNQATDAIIASQATQVQRSDISVPGPFMTTLTFTPPAAPAPAIVEVVTFSARDGLELLLATQPVIIGTMDEGMPAELVERSVAHIASRLPADAGRVRVLRTEPMERADSALGCPAPDRSYTQVITPGYRLVLEAGEAEYAIHTDTGDRAVLCRNRQPEPIPQAAPVR